MNVINNLVAEYQPEDATTVDVFGVVLYTDSNPYVKKVLRDEDSWVSLNEISGDKWIIFSIKPQEGCYTYPTTAPGMMNLMVPIWQEPSFNKHLLNEFKIDSTEKTPVFVIFAIIEGVVVQKIIDIDDSSFEKCYDSLRTVIKKVSAEINSINTEDLGDTEHVFARVSATIVRYKGWKIVKKSFGFYSWIKGLLP